MHFTALHRVLGAPPGPLTDDLLDTAVAAGSLETDDLDWKSELPRAKGLTQTDFPKDVAAMANSGGGVIVYGVTESQKAATGRVDVGEFDEVYERALRSAAITAISPPVFGLHVKALCEGSSRAVVVVVPASIDGPHLIYRNEYFGAPIRNDSDTVWMKERQIEAMYRARFEERRHSAEALDCLFTEARAGRDVSARAWFVAVARPRIPRVRNRYNPRPGLRRWVSANTASGECTIWKEAWASIHDDGSITLAAAVGAHRTIRGELLEGWQVDSSAIECAVADCMALIRTTAEATDNDEYNVRIGIEWSGSKPLTVLTTDAQGFAYDGVSTPLQSLHICRDHRECR